MRRLGTAGIISTLGTIGFVLLIVMYFLGEESPTMATSKFMDALARGDVEKLTELSYMPGRSHEQVLEAWTYATRVAAPHYRFRWKIENDFRPGDDAAAVNVMVTRNYSGGPGDSGDKYGIPLLKIDKKWKIDVRAINKSMYPGLPR